MTIPKVDHLLLLVGGNPLPNAVAAKLLTNSGAKVALLHSKESCAIAERLQNWIEQQAQADVYLYEIDESDPRSISEAVNGQLEESNEKSVGLNYTGGTKAMAVHAYLAVKDWAKEKNIEPVFSYLNPRKLQLVIDPPSLRGNSKAFDVSIALNLNLSDLMELHGWTLKTSQAQPALPETANLLADIHANRSEGFQILKDRLDGKQSDSKHNPSKKQDNLKPKSPIELFENLHGLSDLKDTFCREFNEKINWDRWFRGDWLEDYTLDSLERVKNGLNLNQCLMNIEARKKVKRSSQEVKLELDVVAVRGYQLFVISCTAGKPEKKEMKKKLFEAYIRARQLGGDEARIALVCFFDDPNRLEKEMQRDFDTENRIKVFGKDELSKLSDQIKEWIEEQSNSRQ